MLVNYRLYDRLTRKIEQFLNGKNMIASEEVETFLYFILRVMFIAKNHGKVIIYKNSIYQDRSFKPKTSYYDAQKREETEKLASGWKEKPTPYSEQD